MTVLQIVGSSLDNFMFNLSWFWWKSCPTDVLGDGGAHYGYAIMVPPAKKIATALFM